MSSGRSMYFLVTQRPTSVPPARMTASGRSVHDRGPRTREVRDRGRCDIARPLPAQPFFARHANGTKLLDEGRLRIAHARVLVHAPRGGENRPITGAATEVPRERLSYLALIRLALGAIERIQRH